MVCSFIILLSASDRLLQGAGVVPRRPFFSHTLIGTPSYQGTLAGMTVKKKPSAIWKASCECIVNIIYRSCILCNIFFNGSKAFFTQIMLDLAGIIYSNLGIDAKMNKPGRKDLVALIDHGSKFIT